MLDQTFTWRDQHIRWSRRGNGPPVVLCHGTPWSSALWDPIADALAADFAVYSWDMPGYGASTMTDGQHVGLDVQGKLLSDLLEHWDLDAPHVLAHDYGGAVSLRAHLLHGARFASLALVDVVALAPWGSDFFRLVGENATVFERLPPPLHEALVTAYIRGAAHQPLASADLDKLVAPWRGKIGQAAFYRQIAQADQRFTDDIEAMYPSIDLPVMVIWGTQDTWIPVERAHRLAATIPDAQLRLIDDAGHLIHLDAPERLTAELYRWLAHVST